jgi:hypothetical protein
VSPRVLLQLLLCTAVAVSSGAAASPEASRALQAQWARYLAEETDRPLKRDVPYEYCFRRAAAAHGLPLSLLVAVARGESNFEPHARSHANAFGVMQILWPQTAWELGIYRLSRLLDPCTNIEAGTRYLKMMQGRYDGDLHLSLAAYNYGPNRIPKDASRVPAGATRYSGYIYDHLRKLLGDNRARPKHPSTTVPTTHQKARKTQPGRTRLIAFDNPLRAQAFVDGMRPVVPGARLDVSRSPSAGYEVYLIYSDPSELARMRTALADVGFGEQINIGGK